MKNMGCNDDTGDAEHVPVFSPTGRALTLADLPKANTTQRWVIQRKADVVAAVEGGLLTLADACERYSLSVEEFLSWQQSLNRHGLPGLRVTRIQDYAMNVRSSSKKCRCQCPDGDCEHRWNSGAIVFDGVFSASCSRCGMTAMFHDMHVF